MMLLMLTATKTSTSLRNSVPCNTTTTTTTAATNNNNKTILTDTKKQQKHQLLIRQPKLNSNGSVLLQTYGDGGLWECTECKEWTEIRYTEEGWANRYGELYGAIDEEELKKIVRENDDEASFTSFKKDRLRNPATLSRINTNHTKLLRTTGTPPLNEFKFVDSNWDYNDGTLELFMTRDIKTSKHDIAGTEYTSLLMFFEPVVFEEEDEEEVEKTKKEEEEMMKEEETKVEVSGKEEEEEEVEKKKKDDEDGEMMMKEEETEVEASGKEEEEEAPSCCAGFKRARSDDDDGGDQEDRAAAV